MGDIVLTGHIFLDVGIFLAIAFAYAEFITMIIKPLYKQFTLKT